MVDFYQEVLDIVWSVFSLWAKWSTELHVWTGDRPSIRLLPFIVSASKSSEKPHQVNISPTCEDLNEEFIFDICLISALLAPLIHHLQLEIRHYIDPSWILTNIDINNIITHLEPPPQKKYSLFNLFQDVPMLTWQDT